MQDQAQGEASESLTLAPNLRRSPKFSNQDNILGTSLVVQWLRLQALKARGPGCLIPDQGIRSYMLQGRSKILDAETKTQHSQIYKWMNEEIHILKEHILKNYLFLFIWLCRILAAASELLVQRHVGFSSLTRDWTQALLIGSTES